MTTLTDFLLARIAEDEARAPRKRGDYYDKPCPRCGWPVSGIGSPLDDEVARALHPDDFTGLGCALSPEQWEVLMPDLGPSLEGARVLAECEAKRRIVGMYVGPTEDDEGNLSAIGGYGEAWLDAIRFLALPYADHPDYREEWKV